MRTPALFKEYIWLVNTIDRAGKITFAEINEKWLQTEMSEGIPLSRTTFNRHKDAIEDIFDIIIECDKKDGYRYYILNKEVLSEDSVQNWMLSTLTVNNIISESLSLQHRILLENIPTEGAVLEKTIQAMKSNLKVLVKYHRYQSSDDRTFTLAPYSIKLFRQRWYLLGKFNDGGFAMFSFDRMKDINITDETFKMEQDFDASVFFGECYGVVIGDGSKPERIVLRAFGRERFSMRDLPLHHTQREIGSDDKQNHVDFELTLRPTSDFKSQIISRGAWLKVLEPQWLADEMKQWHEEAAKIYR